MGERFICGEEELNDLIFGGMKGRVGPVMVLFMLPNQEGISAPKLHRIAGQEFYAFLHSRTSKEGGREEGGRGKEKVGGGKDKFLFNLEITYKRL